MAADEIGRVLDIIDWRLAMNDTTPTGKDIAGDAGASLQSSNGPDETDVSAVHAPNGAHMPVLGRRGPARSWLPGILDDPF